MKIYSNFVLFIVTLLSLSFLINCKKEVPKVVPTVKLATVKNITSNSAQAGGEVTLDGGATVTARGVCWSSTNTTPTISDNKTGDGAGLGVFSSTIIGLVPNTSYNLRAYATNSAGTGYFSQLPFKTLGLAPSLITTEIASITTTSASSGGNVTNDFNSPVTSRGVCWSTTSDPTILSNKTINGSGTGSFTSSITGLTPVSNYFVRAYATNNIGTSYGNQLTITTNSALPLLITTSVSLLTAATALSGGTISSDSGTPVIARGVCWSTNQNPTIADNNTMDGTGIGSFTSSIIGLNPNTAYYIRAYATNSRGTSYGNQLAIRTKALLPVITTSPLGLLSNSTVSCGGKITSDGGAEITARGICYSTNQNPTISDNIRSSSSELGGFEIMIYGLIIGETYYIRAYATNAAGTSYGNLLVIKIPAPFTITTNPTFILTKNTASSGGLILSSGDPVITARGVCWNSFRNPTISDNKTVDGNGPGNFSSLIEGLTYLKTYYARAYATNSRGTVYGNEVSFQTIIATTFIGTGKGPKAIAFDGENMWTANFEDNSVTKITPTGEMKTFTGTGKNPYDIAFDGINMWTSNITGKSVTKITPTGAMTTYDGIGPYACEIAFDGTNMWVANGDSNKVTKIAPTGKKTIYKIFNEHPRSIVYNGENIWTGDYRERFDDNYPYISIINPVTGVSVTTGPGGAVEKIKYNGKGMWIRNMDGLRSTAKNSWMGRVFKNVKYGPDFDFAGKYLWMTGINGVILYDFSPTYDYFDQYTYDNICPITYAIAFDGLYMWVTHPDNNSVSKILTQ